MKYQNLLCRCFMLLTVALALAAPHTHSDEYLPRQGNGKCPFGTSRSGDYCRAWRNANNTGGTTSSYNYVEKSGSRCPLGYGNTRGPWCYQRNKDEVPAAGTTTRKGSGCPLGYSKRGDYCVKR
jgi:hypothetical protein